MTIPFPTQANPFTCDADTLSALLLSLLDEWSPSLGKKGSRGYAAVLVGAVAPVLTWVRDHKGVRIDMQQSHFTMELPNLWTLATHKVFRARASVTRIVTRIPVPDMPEALTEPVQAYLDLLAGDHGSVFFEQQPTHPSAQLHNFALLQLAHAFACGSGAASRTGNVPSAWNRQ